MAGPLPLCVQVEQFLQDAEKSGAEITLYTRPTHDRVLLECVRLMRVLHERKGVRTTLDIDDRGNLLFGITANASRDTTESK